MVRATHYSSDPDPSLTIILSLLGKIDNLFHSRKKSNGTIFSSVLDEIESADVAVSVSPRSSISEPSSLPAPSPSKSKSDLIKELLPAGELTVRFVECRDLIPPEGESSVSPFIRVYNKDGQALLKSDTIKKSANPIFQDATLVIRLKEGEAPVYQFVVYHDYALRKSPELGSAVLDFRKLYAEHVRSRGAQYDSTKAGITVFEQVLALLKPNEPHKGSEAGRCRINVTFKRGN